MRIRWDNKRWVGGIFGKKEIIVCGGLGFGIWFEDKRGRTIFFFNMSVCCFDTSASIPKRQKKGGQYLSERLFV